MHVCFILVPQPSLNFAQIISLSDVFISPLEDMYAALQPHSPFTLSPLRAATSLQSYSARISIVS